METIEITPTKEELMENRTPKFECQIVEQKGKPDALTLTRWTVQFYALHGAVAVNGSMHWHLTEGAYYTATLIGEKSMAFPRSNDGSLWVISKRAISSAYDRRDYTKQVLLKDDVDAIFASQKLIDRRREIHIDDELARQQKEIERLQLLAETIIERGLSQRGRIAVENHVLTGDFINERKEPKCS